MEITRMMTVAENDTVKIKQTDCGRVCLNYDNVKIFFSKGGFLNFMIEIDNWSIKNEDKKNSSLVIKACRVAMEIKKEDINSFIKTVRTAAYNIVPILSMYKELVSNESIIENRMN